MQILILRHAEKQSTFEPDPQLSTFGKLQAQELIQKISSGIIPKPEVLYSSHKNRARQTFEPIAEHFKLDLKIECLLNEKEPNESHKNFLERIKLFTQKIESNCTKKTVFLCTHADWLEQFVATAPICNFADHHGILAPATGFHFKLKSDGLWSFEGLII